MKKYLLIIVLAVISFVFYQYMVYNQGFYIKFHDEEIRSNFITKQKQIFHVIGDHEEPFIVKGVVVNGFLPGHLESDYAIDEEMYQTWFSQIQAMGANTIRVKSIMDDDFYNALYKFNKENENPLYLLQGLIVSDYAQNNKQDAYADVFLKTLKQDAISAVDIIHGRKNIILNRANGQGFYRKDISEWVLGFVVGDSWHSDTVAYTNEHAKSSAIFQGNYLATTKDANAFEALLAEVMDTVLTYESDKYDMQHLVTFSNEQLNDPFLYDDNYALQTHKVAHINAEHIVTQDTLKSGYFASYRMQDVAKGMMGALIDSDVKALKQKIQQKDETLGYVQLLTQYHTIPMIVGDYGYSTARGVDRQSLIEQNGKGLNEQQQGTQLVNAYQSYIKNGCQGAIINAWNDNWGYRTWNTSYAKDVHRAYMWNDVQTNDSGYGLMAYEDGLYENQYHCDGVANEWSSNDLVQQENDVSLYMHGDVQYLYLMVKKEGITPKDIIYIPLDISDKSGTPRLEKPALQFDRDIDFLLQIHGEGDTRLLVNERYNAMRENYGREVLSINPFEKVPVKDASTLQAIHMVLTRSNIINDFANTPPQKRLTPTFETGKLTIGNTNPNAKDFNSQADFCYGKNFVEVRIPWLLLNFSDPSKGLIHDDYYEYYGVQNELIKDIYAGAVMNPKPNDMITMREYPLSKWDEVKYHERLKASYYAVYEAWKEDVS